MITEKEFITPSYYKNFSCKCGDCRTPCCGGWSVTVSMKEYFELLSLDCSPELQRKINCALCVCGKGDAEYARLTPNWLGRCHLQREDGLCAVHAECGEWALPSICRVYPRCARSGEILRLSCSASCEKTVELFMDMKDPISFEKSSLAHCAFVEDSMTREEFDVQTEYIKILEDRRIPVGKRLEALYGYMFEKDVPKDQIASEDVLLPIVKYYKDHSDNVEELCRRYLTLSQERKIDCALEELECAYPDFERLAEHLLVNHVFYSAFPKGDDRISREGAFKALCVVYSLTRLFAAAAVFERPCDSDVKILISDAVSAFYRLCEHSSFAYNCTVILKRAGYGDLSCISALTRI